jgi:hypothetical protein
MVFYLALRTSKISKPRCNDGAGKPVARESAKGLSAPERNLMPEKKTIDRARRDKAAGKSASTQAGEFVREEIEHIRRGKHGARSTRQAIAIGLSKARRSGVALAPPERGASPRTRKQAARDTARGRHPGRKTSAPRSRAMLRKLQREGRQAASPQALARQARAAARRRSPAERKAAARKAARSRTRK